MTQTTLESLAAMLVKAWAAPFAPYLKSSDPTLYANITAEIAAVETALNGWKAGSPIHRH